ncbi:MAG: hypothetical protein JST54_28865 [Deltaproteobacteria bacterium]|nr:hypothetical protein [Deltaproteobacteria bacterium]
MSTGSSGTSGTSGDAGVITCDQPASAACGSTCPGTWNDALAQACANPQPPMHAEIGACGSVVVYGAYGADTGTEYIYSADGGALLAVVSENTAGIQCEGGPSSLALPDCGGELRDPCTNGVPGIPCADAGVCGANEYCVAQFVFGPGLPPDDVHFHCAPSPSCEQNPTCDCFNTLDAGICLGAPYFGCSIATGVIDCTYSSP